jgi:hypothetical protein
MSEGDYPFPPPVPGLNLHMVLYLDGRLNVTSDGSIPAPLADGVRIAAFVITASEIATDITITKYNRDGMVLASGVV